MKLQWQLKDVDTGNTVNVDDPFDVVDHLDGHFADMTGFKAVMLYGSPDSIKNPKGIMHLLSAVK